MSIWRPPIPDALSLAVLAAAEEEAALCERRAHLRVTIAEHAELASGLSRLDVQLLDVSSMGARLRPGTGLLPVEGEECILRLLDQKFLVGNVAWIGGGQIGLRLAEEFPEAYRLNWLEDRGECHVRAALRRAGRR